MPDPLPIADALKLALTDADTAERALAQLSIDLIAQAKANRERILQAQEALRRLLERG